MIYCKQPRKWNMRTWLPKVVAKLLTVCSTRRSTEPRAVNDHQWMTFSVHESPSFPIGVVRKCRGSPLTCPLWNCHFPHKKKMHKIALTWVYHHFCTNPDYHFWKLSESSQDLWVLWQVVTSYTQRAGIVYADTNNAKQIPFLFRAQDQLFCWVNYNNSLTWIVRPFGDDFPY